MHKIPLETEDLKKDLNESKAIPTDKTCAYICQNIESTIYTYKFEKLSKIEETSFQFTSRTVTSPASLLKSEFRFSSFAIINCNIK